MAPSLTADFTTYTEARWPALVTFLVEEGLDRASAEEQVTAGLARCRRRWRDLRDRHDLDEQVLAVVTGSHDPARAERFRSSLEVERRLDELPQDDAPVEEIVGRDRSARRRTARRWAVAALALAVVVGGAWWVTHRDDSPEQVRRTANPLPVPWYVDGELHLDEVVVETPRLLRLVQVQGGVVYVDAGGRVAFVDEEGGVETIGRSAGGRALAADQDGDLVAWTETGAGQSRLVAYDVARQGPVGSLPVSSRDATPLAVDQGQVWFRDGDEAFAWPAGGAENKVTQVVRTVLDTAAGAMVSQSGMEELQVVRPFSPVLSLPGVGADLSPDGGVLLTSRPGDRERPLAYDAVSGTRLDLGLPRDQYAVAGGFGPDDSFLFAVRHEATRHTADDSVRLSESGPILLVECRPGMNTPCDTLTQLAGDTAYPPVLAG